MKIVGKISVKTVCGSVPTETVMVPKVENGAVVVKDGKAVEEAVQRGIKQNLMRVFGQCDKIKLGNTAYGETVEFQGQFEATDALTGEVYRGSRLFLPPVIQEMVRAEVLAAEAANGEGKAGVQFAFDIGADSANNAHGYQYTITPLTAPSAADPLAAMKAQLLGNAPPLQISNSAAPVEAGDKTPELATADSAPAETAAESKGGKSKSK